MAKVEKDNEGRKGGYLKGDSHDEPSGGIKAVVTDSNNKPVLLEGDEVIINKKSVNDPSKKTLSGTNKEILHQINTEHGGKPILAKGGNVNDADIEAIQKEWTSLHKQISQKLLELNDKTQWRWFDRLTNKTPGLWDKPMVKHAKEQIALVKDNKETTMDDKKITESKKFDETQYDLKSAIEKIKPEYKDKNVFVTFEGFTGDTEIVFIKSGKFYLAKWTRVSEDIKSRGDGEPTGAEKDAAKDRLLSKYSEQDLIRMFVTQHYGMHVIEAEKITKKKEIPLEEAQRILVTRQRIVHDVKNKMEDGGGVDSKVSIKECLLKDGDNENDYIVEGTKITTGEGISSDTWEITELTETGLTVKHLPKSALGSSLGEKTITYDQLRDDFSKNAIQITGINAGDTRCLNLCIKAIKQCFEKPKSNDIQDVMEEGGQITEQEADERAAELLAKLKEQGYTERLVEIYAGKAGYIKVRERIQANKGKDKGSYSRYHMAANGDRSTAIKQNGYLEEREVLRLYKDDLKKRSSMGAGGSIEKQQLEYLKSLGAKPNSDLNYSTEKNGINYYIGDKGGTAFVVAFIEDDNSYMIDKEDAREMSLTARTKGINKVELHTNYGIELHSTHENPKTIGFDKIKKVRTWMEDGGPITNDDISTQIEALRIAIEEANYDENGNPVDRDYVNGLQDQLDALEILKETK